jgi:hypothetical protein
MRATKSNICCEALFPRYRRRKRVLSRRQFRMRSLAGRWSKDKAAPSIARSGPADVLAPPCRPDWPAPGRSPAAKRRSFRPAGRLSSTTRIFSPCRIRWSRRHGVGEYAAVAFDLMPSVSCTMSSARNARSPGSMRSAASGSVDALQRRFNGVFEIGRAPAPRRAQGLPGVFHNRAVCGDNLVATGSRMTRQHAVRYWAPRRSDSTGA